VLAAWAWRLAGSRTARVWSYAGLTAAFTFLTPLVRQAAWPDALPGPLERYLRPDPNRSTYNLFPRAGFLTAGALAGELIEAARSHAHERRLHLGLFVAALAGVAGGYAASWYPALYENAQFWSSSPTFFFIRLGIVTATVPIAWLISLSLGPIVAMGRSSLFVYWIHVEMAYGALALPLKRSLPWELAVFGALVLSVLLYGLVAWKNAWMDRRSLPLRLHFLAPILK
jgi:hypothetical protein